MQITTFAFTVKSYIQPHHQCEKHIHALFYFMTTCFLVAILQTMCRDAYLAILSQTFSRQQVQLSLAGGHWSGRPWSALVSGLRSERMQFLRYFRRSYRLHGRFRNIFADIVDTRLASHIQSRCLHIHNLNMICKANYSHAYGCS